MRRLDLYDWLMLSAGLVVMFVIGAWMGAQL